MIAQDTEGRKYVAEKLYRPTGRYTERYTGHRYDLIKRYL